MQEIINAIAQKAGISAETATLIVGAVLAFIQKEAPQSISSKILAAFPDSAATIAKAQAAGAGATGLGGLVGRIGSVMGGRTGDTAALMSQLLATGVTVSQLETAGEVLLKGVREEAGSKVVTDLIKQVPELGKILPAA